MLCGYEDWKSQYKNKLVPNLHWKSVSFKLYYRESCKMGWTKQQALCWSCLFVGPIFHCLLQYEFVLTSSYFNLMFPCQWHLCLGMPLLTLEHHYAVTMQTHTHLVNPGHRHHGSSRINKEYNRSVTVARVEFHGGSKLVSCTVVSIQLIWL